LKLFPWAKFRKTKAAVKLHTLIQADGSLPTFLRITDGKVHDTAVAREVDIPEGSYLAIDRAYHDFEQYKSYNDNNIRFVTRKKTNAKFTVIKSHPADESQGVLSDHTIEFTGFFTHKKYPHPLRMIRYFDKETNKELAFLTNDFQSNAFTITQIYKARWEIELFFKTIKQNLKIKRFLGNSPNAVWTQIWIAMIAYLLVSFLKFIHKSKYSIQKLFQRIQINLFERKPLTDILFNRKFIPPNLGNEYQVNLFPSLTGH
jgi:putative transposase